MRTVIRDTKSEWRKVTSRVPQGSVLAPLMFLIYVNDLSEGLSSCISLFANDVKLLRKVNTQEYCKKLLEDLNKIQEWSERWEKVFYASKCHVMEIGKSFMDI